MRSGVLMIKIIPFFNFLVKTGCCRFFIVVAFLACPASRCLGQPTREEIIAFHKDCRTQRIDTDLIGKFGVNYRGLNLDGIDLRSEGRNGRWINAIWRGADLTGARLKDAMLSGAILDGARLDRVKGRGVSLAKELAGASLDDADLREARLDFIKLVKGSARRADLSGAEISAADFGDSDLSGAIFRQVRCQWYPPHFQGANLRDTDFEGARLLPGADFRGANLTRAKLRNATLVRADFRGADLRDADWTDVDIDAALFDGVQGISQEELAALQTKAARWKYDALVFASNALAVGHVVAFFVAPLLAIWMGIGLRRRSTQTPVPDGALACEAIAKKLAQSSFGQTLMPHLGTAIVCLNSLALLVLSSLLLFLFFGSPVAQFNAGDGARMSAWSLWVQVFPFLIWALGLGFLVSAGMLISCCAAFIVNARLWWRPLLALAFTLAHFALEFFFVGRFFPTA
jgi:uncharacterized protein YjbI with pentapeptide repeats